MKNLKSYILKISFLLRKFLAENWILFLIGFHLFLTVKLPFRFLFEKLNFMLGYYPLCGVYAILFTIIRDNIQNKQVILCFYKNKHRYLRIFIMAMSISYIAINHGILPLILFLFSFFLVLKLLNLHRKK